MIGQSFHYWVNMDRKISAVLAGLVVSVFILAACGGNKESWAYIHDPQTEILSLSDNGKAVYKGSNYTYTKDDSFITLKNEDGSETKMRYVPDAKDEGSMILYESMPYNYTGDGSPNGVIGHKDKVDIGGDIQESDTHD